MGYNSAILDVVADGIICIDEYGRIMTFNKSAETMFGYTADEMIGQKINVLMPASHAEWHDTYLRNYSTSGKAKLIGMRPELEGKRRDGEIFPIEVGLTEAHHEGKRVFVSVVRDITERKRVERLKAEFIATVSHELRTPLTAVYGPLSLIKSGELGTLSPAVDNATEIAVRNCQSLMKLVDDLLDFEKLSSGRLSLDSRSHEVRALVGDAVLRNQALAGSYGVTLAQRGGSVDTYIHVDEDRFQQILGNLIANALKFSEKGAAVHIEVSEGADLVKVSVTDTGIGIAEEHHDRIFKRFSQVDGSDARSAGGSGLGLAISKDLTERMGGEIGFASAAGQGATFWVSFPRATRPDPADVAEGAVLPA